MSLKKNQIFETTIENLSSDGSGVAHVEGQAVFVPGAAPGDVIRCRIVKALKSYAFGRIDAILVPGPGRVAPDCAVCTPCGGCGLRHLSYATECEAKTGFVRDAFARLGGFDVSSFEFSPVLALTDHTAHYRNKVQLPVGLDADGHVVTGFYAGRTHRIVPCPDCKLQPEWMNALARRACALLEANGIAPYDEETGKGRVRHLYMRQGWHSGQRLLCFVVNGNGLPNEAEICRTLQQEFQLTTVLINRNTARTNVILGRDTRTVLGPGVIEDTLAGVPIQMGVHEFYQVNTPAAELLYAKAKEFARLQPDDFLLDLYCGMGTIGLSMKPHCRRLVGVEVVPQAVEGAKTVAAHLGLPPEEADFYCMDAGEAATRLASEGAHPDVIVVDPPRKGCDNATLTAIVQMAPRTLVMVSCNPSTAARDAKFLCEQGYTLEKVQPVDLFPRTRIAQTDVVHTLRDFELKETDYVYEPGQFAVRGSILDVYSYSCEYPFRIDFFGDEIDTIRTFDVETQLSQAKRTEIEIVPELAHIESNKQCFLNFLSESTPVVAKDLSFVCDRIGQIYTEGFSSQSLTEQLEGATEVEAERIRHDMKTELNLVSPLDFKKAVAAHLPYRVRQGRSVREFGCDTFQYRSTASFP